MANILLAFAVKGLSLLISTFSLPLYIKFFRQNEVLGVWYTVLSILSWINICDLGLGNGLRNKLTECISKNDICKAKKYISSTYVLLIIVIVPVAVLIGFLIPCIDLNAFFHIQPELISPAVFRKASIILICGVGVNFVLKTINSILYALQAPSANNVISLVASLIPLCFIAVYKGDSIETNFFVMSLMHVFAINIPLFLATVIVFSKKTIRKFKPDIKSFDLSSAKITLSLGMRFFLAQAFFMLLMSTNELLISRLYLPEFVVEYNIYYKLFMVIGSLFMLALTPFWSKITKDLAEGNYQKMKSTNNILYFISLTGFVAEFALIFALQFIVDMWLRDKTISIEYSKAIIFAFFGGIYILNIVLTTVANGIGELKTQIVFYGIGVVCKLPVTYLLRRAGLNWEYLVLYNCVILTLFCCFQYAWIERKIKSLTEKAQTI